MEGSNSGDDVHAETSNGSGGTVELKIKTLDSQVYTCIIDRNVSVPALKEHVSALTGVPVENQRLICRGKVLKDDQNLSAYNVEDGHTLHLVTRQLPPPGAPSSSVGATQEEQGGEDASQGGTRGRPAHISHSVVMGTFNVPDNGDGGLPDVNRIISSVLTSLGLGNVVPTAGGTNVTGVVNPPASSATGTGQESGSGTGRQQSVSEASNPSSAPGISTASFTPVMLPAMGQQLRFVQQAIPDALTTMSQYLDSLELVLANSGQPASASTPPSSGLGSNQPSGSSAAIRPRPTPANLGAVIRRTMDLITGQAREELNRLSSQLENEVNLTDATARGDVQTSALRDGVLLQHLGSLLLELGRATLTLRMGTSDTESVVNAGPAVFISPAGPNPMMVQPLPFQPSTGFNFMTPGQQPPAAAMATGEVPRNISIHIHSNDNAAFLGSPFQSAMAGQGSGASNPSSRLSSGNGGTVPPSNGSAPAPSVHTIALPIPANNQSTAGEQQSGVRVVPVRAVVAALPSNLQGRPPVDISAAPSGLLHPLLARFQQLNSQQPSVTPSVALHGISATPVTVTQSAGIPQQSSSSIPPTIRAQVQVQAWVPDGQGGSRLLSNEEALRTLFTPPSNNTQNPSEEQPGETDRNESTDREQGLVNTPQAPTDQVNEAVQEIHRNEVIQSEVEKEEKGKDNLLDSSNGETSAREGSSSEVSVDKLQPKVQSTATAPVGLGLRGLQPLPSRNLKRSSRNQSSHPASSSGQTGQESAQLMTPPTHSDTVDSSVITSGAIQPANNVNLLSSSGNDLDIGSMVSQLLAGSAGAGTSGVDQGPGIPTGALGNLMGQVMQNPFMRNVVQQVVDQVGEGEHEDAAFQGAGSLDFPGLLQQMMPIVGQALSRANVSSNSDPVSSLLQGVSSRSRSNSARPNVDRPREGSAPTNGPNLSSLLQQMMPVVAQALSSGNLGAMSQPTCMGMQANQNSISNAGRQIESNHQEESSNTPCQIGAAQQQESTSFERSDTTPISKRQKINLEKAVEKVEQGSPPDEIFRVIAETASMIVEPNEVNTSSLAQILCQDDSLVEDYMSLLLRDLSFQKHSDH